jgi:hypothetical protein
MSTTKPNNKVKKAPGDSPITVGGGGGRGPKLWLKINKDDWDLSKIKDTGYIEMTDAAKGAKRLTLTAGDVSVTVPIKGSINLVLEVN